MQRFAKTADSLHLWNQEDCLENDPFELFPVCVATCLSFPLLCMNLHLLAIQITLSLVCFCFQFKQLVFKVIFFKPNFAHRINLSLLKLDRWRTLPCNSDLCCAVALGKWSGKVRAQWHYTPEAQKLFHCLGGKSKLAVLLTNVIFLNWLGLTGAQIFVRYNQCAFLKCWMFMSSCLLASFSPNSETI